jgi:hypothetical protein
MRICRVNWSCFAQGYRAFSALRTIVAWLVRIPAIARIFRSKAAQIARFAHAFSAITDEIATGENTDEQQDARLSVYCPRGL